MEVGVKRFLFLSNCTPDTILKLSQMSEAQRIKIKRELLLLLDLH